MNPLQQPTDFARPALSPITPDDHAGQVWILTTLAVIYTGASLIVRGSIKWNLFWLDDYLLAISTAVHFIQAGVVFYGLRHGLSRFNSITADDQWALAGRAFLASETLAVIALCLAKCSVWALLLRIFIADGAFNDWRVKLCAGFVVFGAAWGVAAVVGIVTSCDADTMLSSADTSQCAKQLLRWQIITALDVGTEILGSLLPVVLVWSLNMGAKGKFHVFLAFSFRLPLVVFSILHLEYFRQYPHSTEPLFAVTNTLLCQQAMLVWSLISATIPNVKSFMKVFNFSMGMGALDERLSHQAPYSIPLRSFRDRTAPSPRGGASQNDEPALRPDQVQHMFAITSSDRGTTDDGYSMKRNDSQEMIIRKEVQIRVSHEQRR